MNRKKKIGLMMILGMGILYALLPSIHKRGYANWNSAGAISIYKATTLTGLDVLTDYTCMLTSPFNHKYLLMYIDTSFSVFLWTSIEGNTIIIAACIPTVAPLLECIFGNNVLRGPSAEQSSYYRRKGRRNMLAQHNRGSDSKGPILPPAALVRDSTSASQQQRSRKGSAQYQDQKGWMSSTLNSRSSRDSNLKSKLSPTSPSYSNMKSMASKTDVESQTSILDYDERHLEEEEEEDEIEMSHISRHDSFRIQYETVADPNNPRNEHNVIEGGTTDRNGRPLSLWRRSFSKYGYPGLSGYHHTNSNNHNRNNSGDKGNRPGS